jgi:hypothetical protein
MIVESCMDNIATDCLCIRWKGDQPSDQEFLDYAARYWDIQGKLIDVQIPTRFCGSLNLGRALIKPCAQGSF